METPILFLVYNRPEHTERVFEAIRKIRPKQLFIASDGPRKEKPGDEIACSAVHSIISEVDWPCEVKTLFRPNNMGLRNAIPDAITWFFEHVDSGIILEDDCLPSHAFFNFCSKLLDKYKDEERIAHINGSNFLLKKRFKIKGSYYFSNVFHPWGWATWKRAWNKFDPEMQGLDEFIAKDMLQPVTRKTLWRDTYYGLLTRTRRKEIDTWDYTWYYCLWKEQKLAITPALNLVSNIGFGSDATNTNYTYSRLSGMKAHNIYNMNDPPDYSINLDADEFALSVKFREGQGTFMDRLKEKIRLTLFR